VEKRLAGKPVVEALKAELKERISTLKLNGKNPTLCIVRVGNREDDISYERSIIKNGELLGVKVIIRALSNNISMDLLSKEMTSLNKDDSIHGIMIFRPLPDQLDVNIISKIIDPKKDVDGMSPINLEKIFEGDKSGYAPCTAKAVVEMLKFYKIPLSGANITVVGRSMVVGKPLSMLLLNDNATVTICHSRTKDIPEITQKSDVVVAAVGRAKFLGRQHFNDKSIVIDVGINDAGDGKMCGDVDYEGVFDMVSAISPALGGIGSITTTVLFDHTVDACEKVE